MIGFFLLIPFLTILSAVSLYRHHGKREFLKFDFLQFVYAFVFMPILFIWIKTVLFFLLRRELNLGLTVNELFIIDTVFSVISLYVSAFLVIHSITASFKLKLYKDPLHDLFTHSEYFHLWFSHLGMYLGGMILMVILGAVNAWIPLPFTMRPVTMYASLCLAVLMGVIIFLGLRLSNPLQGNYMRIMKLALGTCFVLLVGVYFWVDPKFSSEHDIFWVVSFTLASATVCSALGDRTQRTSAIIDKMTHPYGWGDNVTVVSRK